jgi:multidrug efflux pump subunit AcrB
MTTSHQSTPPIEEIEDAVSATELGLAVVARGFEVGLAVLIGLLVCPPLLIAIFLVVAPLAALAIALSLIAAVLAAPYLLVRHLRGHHVPHASVYARRLRHAGHAIAGLLPHHVVREARNEPLL